MNPVRWAPLVLLLVVTLVTSAPSGAQEVRIQDLTLGSQDVPTRLMGYGLVVGLDGSGDRVIGFCVIDW